MIAYSSKYRSSQEEIMDNFELQGSELDHLLKDLKIVNTLLGGFSISLAGLDELIKDLPKNKQLTLIDLGCGDGEQLRQCAQWAKKKQVRLHCIGIDANKHILEIARDRSTTHDNITFQLLDLKEESHKLPDFDIALCTLFLHHLTNEDVIALLQKLSKKARLGILVNDLHRSRWAFVLFTLFRSLFLKTKIAKYDGLVSVARGFKRKELIKLCQSINGIHSVSWHWAFRYKWIIKTNP